jgi:hypothetical protein
MRKYLWIIRILIASVPLLAKAEAAMVMPFTVEQMAQRAEKIFVGTCTKVEHTVNAQGMPVIEVSFSVSEALKGEVGDTVTFRQIDPTPRQQTDLVSGQGSHLRVRSLWSAAALAGVPTYAPGEEMMLFLAKEGQLGLTAPMGLWQGKMAVTTTATGEKRVINGALKKTARKDLTLPEPGQAASYDQFVAAIRAATRPAQ